MKKKILSLAVAAGLSGVMAGAAHAAMHINDKGMGEALVYPFYSAEGGNDTYIHVTNTTGFTKAVKVRFIEAENSAEVLDFNLYLSPHDVWAAAITASPQGGGVIRTVDNSCTVPDLGQGNPSGGNHGGTKTELGNGLVLREQFFSSNAYRNTSDTNKSITRTAAGYVEIIEMGQLDSTTGYGLAALHDEDGIPTDRAGNAMNPCADLVKAWANGGTWRNEANSTGTGNSELLAWHGEGEDGASPAGGLWGYGVVLNVAQGTAVGYDAIAIDDFNGEGEEFRRLHFAPGNNLPSLQQAQPIATIFDGATATDYLFDEGDEAVSALFMSETISNDYVTDPDINAATDWVVTMPTKRFFSVAPVRDPFTRAWDGTKACESVGMEHWDREEAFTPPQEEGFSPAPPQAEEEGFALCTEVSIVQFGDYSTLNGSERITYGFPTNHVDGWARMSFEPGASGLIAPGDRELVGAVLETEAPVTFVGLPVVGFAAISYQNNAPVEGSSFGQNYSAGVTHKSEQLIVLGETDTGGNDEGGDDEGGDITP